MLKRIFSSNFTLTHDERMALRGYLQKWGAGLAALIFIALAIVGVQNPSPEQGKFFDIAQKFSFGLMRLVLSTFGFFLGGFLGYVLFQVVEASQGGSDTTLPKDAEGEKTLSTKLKNRGFLLALCVVGGAITLGLTLAGN